MPEPLDERIAGDDIDAARHAARVLEEEGEGPLDAQETREYVKHRLSVAGREAPLFDEQALALLFEHSGGVPRRINIIAGNALVEGFGQGAEVIGREIIESVVKDG